ncbi:MAG: hypothetical protein KBT58_06215 [Bizionia sp.]|nr:hypothetical protein [Bizionia sp.]
MKIKLTVVFVACLFFQTTFAQEDDYMQKITQKACECVSDLSGTENISSEELGLCMLGEAVKYKEQLLRDHNINMMNIDMEGEELGRLIGLRMISECPDVMMKMVAMGEDDTEEFEETLYVAEGKIKAISKEEFIVFSLKTDDGRTSKFYWLTFIQSDTDLQNNYEKLKGKKVTIEYDIYEFYDTKLQDYRNYNIIESINTVE